MAETTIYTRYQSKANTNLANEVILPKISQQQIEKKSSDNSNSTDRVQSAKELSMTQQNSLNLRGSQQGMNTANFGVDFDTTLDAIDAAGAKEHAAEAKEHAAEAKEHAAEAKEHAAEAKEQVVQKVESTRAEHQTRLKNFNEKFNSVEGRKTLTLKDLQEAMVSAQYLTSSSSPEDAQTIKAITDAATKFISEFKQYLTKNLNEALTKAKDKLEQETNPAKKATLEAEVKKIEEALKTVDALQSMQGKELTQIIAEMEKNPVLKEALEQFLKFAKNDGTGKYTLDNDQTKALNEKLFGIVFKDPEQREFIARTIYDINPFGFMSFFKAQNVKDLLLNLKQEDADVKKKQEESKARQLEENQAAAAARNHHNAAHKAEAIRLAKIAIAAKDEEKKNALKAFGSHIISILLYRGIQGTPKLSDLAGMGANYIEGLIKDGTLNRNEPELRQFLFKYSAKSSLIELFAQDDILKTRGIA